MLRIGGASDDAAAPSGLSGAGAEHGSASAETVEVGAVAGLEQWFGQQPHPAVELPVAVAGLEQWFGQSQLLGASAQLRPMPAWACTEQRVAAKAANQQVPNGTQ